MNFNLVKLASFVSIMLCLFASLQNYAIASDVNAAEFQKAKQEFPANFPFPADSAILVVKTPGDGMSSYFLTYSTDQTVEALYAKYGDFLKKINFTVNAAYKLTKDLTIFSADLSADAPGNKEQQAGSINISIISSKDKIEKIKFQITKVKM
jgi:hypothetical protein